MFDEKLSNTDYNDNSLTSNFVDLCLEAQALAKTIPVNIHPFSDSKVPHFSNLTAPQKIKTVQALESSVAVCQQTLQAGNGLGNSRALVWNYLKHFGLVPCSDLFSHIAENDLVEIFDTNHFQIFRNFRFFEFCSYTIEDILCRPWVDLFIRDDSTVGEQLVKIALHVSSGDARTTLPTNIQPHIIREIKSVFCHEIEIDVKYVSPLFDRNKQIAAYMAIESARLISRLSPEEEGRRLKEYYAKSDSSPLELVSQTDPDPYPAL